MYIQFIVIKFKLSHYIIIMSIHKYVPTKVHIQQQISDNIQNIQNRFSFSSLYNKDLSNKVNHSHTSSFSEFGHQQRKECPTTPVKELNSDRQKVKIEEKYKEKIFTPKRWDNKLERRIVQSQMPTSNVKTFQDRNYNTKLQRQGQKNFKRKKNIGAIQKNFINEVSKTYELSKNSTDRTRSSSQLELQRQSMVIYNESCKNSEEKICSKHYVSCCFCANEQYHNKEIADKKKIQKQLQQILYYSKERQKQESSNKNKGLRNSFYCRFSAQDYSNVMQQCLNTNHSVISVTDSANKQKSSVCRNKLMNNRISKYQSSQVIQENNDEDSQTNSICSIQQISQEQCKFIFKILDKNSMGCITKQNCFYEALNENMNTLLKPLINKVKQKGVKMNQNEFISEFQSIVHKKVKLQKKTIQKNINQFIQKHKIYVAGILEQSLCYNGETQRETLFNITNIDSPKGSKSINRIQIDSSGNKQQLLSPKRNKKCVTEQNIPPISRCQLTTPPSSPKSIMSSVRKMDEKDIEQQIGCFVKSHSKKISQALPESIAFR